MDDDIANANWNPQLEKIISDEGERALCYSWLHAKSQKQYSNYNDYIMIPGIVMSTLCGSASIGSSTLFGTSPYIGVGIGILTLSVGVVNTISSYFSWAKRSESHKHSAARFSKIYRFIVIEMALPRKERIAAKVMLKIVREEINQLHETSPQIPDRIIDLFKKEFKDSIDITKPEITNGLEPIHVFSECISPSTSNHILSTLQTSSLAHPLISSASGNNCS